VRVSVCSYSWDGSPVNRPCAANATSAVMDSVAFGSRYQSKQFKLFND